jgi:hypothetical protein
MSAFDHLNAVLLNVVKVVGCKGDFIGKDTEGMEIFLLGFLKLGRFFGWICVVESKN